MTTQATEKKSPSFEFKTVVTVLMALTSLWVATIVWLQSGMLLNMNFALQQSQAEAVRAFGQLTRADQRVTHGLDIYSKWHEAGEHADHFTNSANAARLGGDEQIAVIHDEATDRWEQLQDHHSELTPLLTDEFDGQYINFYEELHRESYITYQLQLAFGREATIWATKVGETRTAITMLSVTLFLFGLSLNIDNWVRFLFAGGAFTLEFITAVIILLALRIPIDVTTRGAIEHFVDGQIFSNIAYVASEEDAQAYTEAALTSFDAAIALDDQFADAYQWRGFTYMQTRIQDADPKLNALAAEDMETAIALGNDGSVVYTNLGWAYTLSGNYDNAITALHEAIEAEPTECTARMNLGLALMANGQDNAASQAYDQAIDCLLQESPDEQANLFASAITDLNDLAELSPGKASITTRIDQFKENAASLKLVGNISPETSAAQISGINFAGGIGANGEFVDVGDSFTAGVPSIYTIINFKEMPPETPWMLRWTLDGDPFDVYIDDSWGGETSGQARVRLRGAPLPSGNYSAEVYVGGKFLSSADFTVQEGDTQTMLPHISSFFQVLVNHPKDWVAFEDHSADSSLFISPQGDNQNFFWYTSFPWADEDNESVLSGLMVTWYSQYPDMEYSEPGEFFLGGQALASYMPVTYSDADGNELAALLVSMSYQGEAHMLVLQAPKAEFDQTYDLIFDPMLRSFEIAP